MQSESAGVSPSRFLSASAAKSEPFPILLFDWTDVLSMRSMICVLLLGTAAASAGIVVDRMAVIVGKHVIKLSDIDRDLRLTAFLNRESLKITPETKRQAAERLIDQEIIRQEIVTGGFRRP